jgi:hypothetical protein
VTGPLDASERQTRMSGVTSVKIVGLMKAPGRLGRPPPTTTVAPVSIASCSCSITVSAWRAEDSGPKLVAGSAASPGRIA